MTHTGLRLVWCDNSLACLTRLPQGTNCSAKLARHNNQRIRGKPIKFQISACHRVCDLRYGNPRWKATQRILKACCFIYKAPTFSSLEYVNIEWVRTPWTAEKVKLTLKDWPSHEVLVLPQTHASFRPMSRGVIAIFWLLFLWSPNICATHTHRSIPTAAKVNRNMYKLSFICNFKVVMEQREQHDNLMKFHNQGDECHVYFLLTLVGWGGRPGCSGYLYVKIWGRMMYWIVRCSSVLETQWERLHGEVDIGWQKEETESHLTFRWRAALLPG